MNLRLRFLTMAALAAGLAFGLAPGIASKASVHSKQVKGDYRIKVRFPVLYGTAPTAQDLIKTANARIKSEVARMENGFLKEFGSGPPADSNSAEYEHDTDFEMGVLRPSLASILFKSYEYTGGAHGNTAYSFLNFGLIGGKAVELKLWHLFRSGTNPGPIVSKLILAKLRNREGAYWVKSGQVSSLDQDQVEQFRIVAKGLEFVFEPYVMGPYSSGSFRVLLTWKELSPHLDGKGVLKGVLF